MLSRNSEWFRLVLGLGGSLEDTEKRGRVIQHEPGETGGQMTQDQVEK